MSNKKALNDKEVQSYKLEKEEPIGTSKWGTRLIAWFIIFILFFVGISFILISVVIDN